MEEDGFIKGLEDDKARYNKIEEEKEKLDWIGQESEKKGIRATQEVMKEEEKKTEDKKNTELEILDTVRKKNTAYREQLLFQIHHKLKYLQWPKNWEWGVWFDGKGVLLVIKSSDKKIHKRAFQISYIVKYDYAAVNTFTIWAEDLIDFIKIEDTSGQTSIWTPQGALKIN